MPTRAAADAAPPSRLRAALRELALLDEAAYAALATVPTPLLDRWLGRLSRAADHSGLWLATAAALPLLDRRRGPLAARRGLVAIAAASTLVNAGVKLVGRRPRPDRLGAGIPLARHVPMPSSSSFPSGHAASAFAFAGAAGRELPLAGPPLRLLAATVAYSRVHTGVHYPLDVVAGALAGAAVGSVVRRPRARRRRSSARRRPRSAARRSARAACARP
jgi:undecaprenyl-diphosphatase